MCVAGVIAAMAVIGCGGGGSSSSDRNTDMAQSVGKPEGQLNLVAWAGYVSNPWKSDFTKETGCQVNVKVAGTSDEMVQLMRTGQYDGVSASGDATLRLIDGGDVDPVNTDLVSNYKDVFPGLKDQPYNSVDGQMYGIPHGRGANLLMYNKDVVKPAPKSWSAVFDPNEASKYSGKVTAYDSPIYIADAALYLMKHQPDLGITNPYELDDDQFNAAIDLLKQQNENIGQYWSDYTKEISAFTNGDSVVGTTWQVINQLLQGDNQPVDAILPSEGSTGWSDTWMISSDAQHPNCMYEWMNWIIWPKVNAQVAEWFGEAPANSKACDMTSDPKFCDTYHAGDEAYSEKIHYWTTPIEQCLDGRTDVTCTTYQEWTQAWTEIKG
jgi:putative spermidine/putrescine transport system substrate-binding protein